MPTREEVSLALAEEQQFKKYIKNNFDFIDAAQYPEFTLPLFTALVSSTGLFKHVIHHNLDLYHLIVNCFPAYAHKVWGKIIQDIQQGQGELFKRVIDNIEQLAHTLIKTPDVKTPVISSFLANHKLVLNYLYGNQLNIFFEKFPEFKEEFELQVMSKKDTLESLLLSLSVDHLVCFMTTAYPEVADSIFARITKSENLFLHFFYDRKEKHLAKFFVGLKLLPEKYHAQLWEAALLYITPVLLKNGSKNGNSKAIEILTNDLIKPAVEAKVAGPVLNRVMETKDLFLRFFYDRKENHLAKFFVGLKILPEQYHRPLWQAAVEYIMPTLLKRGIKKNNPAMIEVLINDLIKPVLKEKVITSKLANACLKILKSNASTSNERLKEVLATLEQLLSSSITQGNSMGVRHMKHHTFLSGTVPNTKPLDASHGTPIPVGPKSP